MKTRRALLLALAALPLASLGQPQKVRRIGFLAARSRSTAANPDVYYDTFVQRMGELGYVEGRNLVIEWRAGDGKFERFPTLAIELVRANVEVIVTHSINRRTAQALGIRIPQELLLRADEVIG